MCIAGTNSTVGLFVHQRLVDGLAVVRAVRRQRGNFNIDLIKPPRHLGNVADIDYRQLRGNDFMRDGIDPEV